MAVELGKVMSKLNETFKGTSITENFKKAIAAKWAAKIETDDDIETYVEDRKDDMLEASKDADRRATQAADKARKDAAKAAAGEKPDEEKPKPELPNDTPEYMKAFMNEFKEMKAEITGLKASKQAETLESRYKSHEGLKGIPPEFLNKRAMPKSEEEIEAYVIDAAKDWGAIQTQYKFTALGADAPAGSGKEGEGSKDKQASKEQIDAVLNLI